MVGRWRCDNNGHRRVDALQVLHMNQMNQANSMCETQISLPTNVRRPMCRCLHRCYAQRALAQRALAQRALAQMRRRAKTRRPGACIRRETRTPFHAVPCSLVVTACTPYPSRWGRLACPHTSKWWVHPRRDNALRDTTHHRVSGRTKRWAKYTIQAVDCFGASESRSCDG
jgi:hypothetical protein